MNLSQLSSWPEMPRCLSAQVPRQDCTAEDQGRLEWVGALEQEQEGDCTAGPENTQIWRALGEVFALLCGENLRSLTGQEPRGLTYMISVQ